MYHEIPQRFFFRTAEIKKILKNDKKQPFLAFYGLKNGSKIKRIKNHKDRYFKTTQVEEKKNPCLFLLKFQIVRFAEKSHILDFKSQKIRKNIEFSPILT